MQAKPSTFMLMLLQAFAAIAGPLDASLSNSKRQAKIPGSPNPERIKLTNLPLPPAISDYSPGACSTKINPRKTGCMPVSNGRGFMSGEFLPDNEHVLALIPFVGAPKAPEPGSQYNGSHIVLYKTGSDAFSNGEKWKCLTCGVPGVPNNVPLNETEHLDYPQAFDDGKRALVGPYILDCGEHKLASDRCTTKNIRLLPIRWNTQPDGSGPGGAMRELRIHPDNIHLGFSSFSLQAGKLGQFAYYGRLKYNGSPTQGLPLAPRYDVINVNLLLPSNSAGPVVVKGNNITVDYDSISIGELRGFSGQGDEVVYVGSPSESSNIDAYAADLSTGKVRRITSHPEYIDPIHGSRDGKWWAIMDTRGTDRQMFLAGMRGIPPLTDLVSSSVTSATRNNGLRRFFVPYVLDNAGDRGSYYDKKAYFGQKINGPGFDKLGSGTLNDPQWNGQADPRWSFDSTKIVYWEAQTKSPACGGSNPLPCFASKEPGGRDVRMVLATFFDRKPSPYRAVAERPDVIPWATPHVPGAAMPDRPTPPAGHFVMEGKSSGSAAVTITKNNTQVQSVSVIYHNFSDDERFTLNGYENVTLSSNSPTNNLVDWYSNLTQTGPNVVNYKVSSPDGFHLTIDVLRNVFDATGTLTTTLDGKVYKPPLNGA